MRLKKPLSVLQIFASLIVFNSILIFTFLAGNSYLLGTKAYDEALTQNFEQKTNLSQQVIETSLQHVNSTVSYWSGHAKLIQYFHHPNEKKLRSLIDEDLDKNDNVPLDLLYLCDLQGNLILDVSSPFYLSKLIFNRMIRFNDDEGSFLFQEENGPQLIYFHKKNLIDPVSKELLGQVYGGMIVNHWLDFATNLGLNTRSKDMALFFQHTPIISSKTKAIESFADFKHDIQHNKTIIKRDNYAYFFVDSAFGKKAKVELLFAESLDKFRYLERRYILSSILWLLLILVLTTISILFFKKVIQSGLNDILLLPKSLQNSNQSSSFELTSIREFNSIGKAIEDMIRTIKKNEKIFHSIFDHSEQFMGLLHPDGTLITANKKTLKHFNIKLEDVKGKKLWNTPWWDFSPEMQLKVRQAVEKAQEGETVQFEAYHPNAKDAWKTTNVFFSIKPVRDDNGKIILLIPEGQDISAIKEAEEVLRQHNLELEKIVQDRTSELTNSLDELQASHRQIALVTSAIEASGEAIIIFRPQGDVLYRNRAFDKFFELDGTPIEWIHQIFPERSHFQQKISDLLQGMEWVEKISTRTVKRRPIELMLNANLIQSTKEDQDIKIVMSLTDLTRLVKTEEKLQQSELEKVMVINANRARSAFLANMSHELRTPLHCIISFTGLAQKKIHTSELQKVNSYLETVSECTGELSDLIDQLLLLASLEAGLIHYTKRQYSIDILINDVEKHFKKKLDSKKITFTYHSNNPKIKANFDSHHLIHVFNGLMANAIKYASPQTTIEVNVDDYVENQQLYTIVSFKNVGLPIPQNELEYIFSNFNQKALERTDSGGTGLGLSICRRIIEDHNGRIWANSTPEGVTVINLILPKNDEGAEN